jgi:hypothetical protein
LHGRTWRIGRLHNLAAAPHRTPHSREQFLGTERLRNVIIGAEFEQENFIFNFIIRAEHHHRHPGSVRLESAADFLARQPRKF